MSIKIVHYILIPFYVIIISVTHLFWPYFNITRNLFKLKNAILNSGICQKVQIVL